MAAPRVVQVAMCSADLPHTLRLYTEVFGFADAGVRGGDLYIEVVRYDDPAGRPRPAGSRLSDQGLMNVAAGSRDRADLERLYERIVAGGYRPNAELMPGSAGGTYLEDADGNSFEVLAVPREFDPLFGFTPGAIFDPHPFWPQPGAPPAATSGS